MSKRISILAAALLIISAAALVAAQTTTVTQTPTTVTKTVQNPDGTFTVIEYPLKKETVVTLNPVTLTKSKGTATILRDDDGTRVVLNLTDIPADVSAMNVYAVDDSGAVTSLGPVVLANGTGKFTATTPLTKFMLITAPDESLTAYDPNGKIFFRSAVPAGFTAIPRATVAAVTTPAVTVTTPTTTTVTPATTTVTTPATVTQTVQNADGTYSIIEYPVGKETIVNLNPVSITGAKGVATILRDDNGTRIKINMTGLPADLTGLTLYAVDPEGAVSALGPIAVTNGVGTFNTTTPLNRFMLVASPETALTTYDPNTKVFFRSAVPEGFAVIPHTTSATGETVAASSTTGGATTVPMLNIPVFKKGDDTKIKVDFSGAMSGARANVFIEPEKNGETKVKMRFHELKEAPTGQAYLLWAVSPDNQFHKLGQIANIAGKNEAEINANTTLSDFGLLVTMEPLNTLKTVVVPAGPRLGVIHIVP
jgi:hypothetical protein